MRWPFIHAWEDFQPAVIAPATSFTAAPLPMLFPWLAHTLMPLLIPWLSLTPLLALNVCARSSSPHLYAQEAARLTSEARAAAAAAESAAAASVTARAAVAAAASESTNSFMRMMSESWMACSSRMSHTCRSTPSGRMDSDFNCKWQ